MTNEKSKDSVPSLGWTSDGVNNNQKASLQMLNMITGFWTPCCIAVAANLNIADLLAAKPKTIEELSIEAHCNAGALYRLMRALCSIGVFTENNKHEFELTSIGNTLRSDVQGSLKAYAIAQLSEHYAAWGNLIYSVKTGGIAFDNLYGMDVWKYFDANPEQGKNFGKAMSGLTESSVQSILQEYPFSTHNTIVDIGGGNGGLLTTILTHSTSVKGIIYDEVYMELEANERIKNMQLAERCIFEKGSFFESVPADADCYIMKKILHDWNDEQCVAILKNVHRAMKPESKLLIIEAIILEGNGYDMGKFFDINMLAITGGRERTEKEWKQLLIKADLKVMNVLKTSSPMFSILEVGKQSDK